MVIQRYLAATQPASALAEPHLLSEAKQQWNSFVQSSRNGTFLFERDYMDYHATRFNDYSLMFMQANNIVAVMPANQIEDTLITHGGLTFGGLVMANKLGAIQVLDIFTQLGEYLHQHGFKKLIYKATPHIYHRVPSEDDLYALHRLGATTERMDLSTTIQQTSRLPLAKMRLRAIAKAKQAEINIVQSQDYASFWALLSQVLSSQHGAIPTHSVEEITQLANRFSQIKLYLAIAQGQLLAGTVIYHYGTVAHAQYLASSDIGKQCGALDYLLEHLITQVYVDQPYFNFGISTSNAGHNLNAGLSAQKEMFGGRSTILQWLTLSCA